MKFHGAIGFWLGDKETELDVWEPDILEKPYHGEVIKNSRRFQDSGHQNDNMVINNTISIISDLYARENWSSIRYVLWNGIKWKVTSVTIEDYPRLTLYLGEVYNDAEERQTERNFP